MRVLCVSHPRSESWPKADKSDKSCRKTANIWFFKHAFSHRFPAEELSSQFQAASHGSCAVPEILSSGWHLTWSTCIEMIHIKKRSNKINKAQHIKGSHVWAVYMLLFLKKTCFINFHLGLNMVDTGLDLLFMISGYFWIFLDELNHVIPLKIMIFRWPPVRWRGHKRPKSGDGAWAVAKSCATNLGWFKA